MFCHNVKCCRFVRPICLEDILSFHNSDKACAFNKDDVDELISGTSKKCQIDCAVVSIYPNLSDVHQKEYEIEKMELYFVSSSYKFVRDKACGGYNNTHFNITIGCEGDYIKDRRIGESCVSDQQCVSVNSICNGTTGEYQCKTEYLYLSETSICYPACGLGKLCFVSRQCNESSQHSTCGTGKKCHCKHGYLEHGNTCLPERVLSESCDISLQCSSATFNSISNDTTGICTCADVVDTCINNTQTHYSFGEVIYSGVIGLVLGIFICAIVNFVTNRIRNDPLIRPCVMNKKMSNKITVQVSQNMNFNPNCNEKYSHEEEENDIYNHLHEVSIEFSAESEYDQAQQLDSVDDDYSHVTTFNADRNRISGEYGVIASKES